MYSTSQLPYVVGEKQGRVKVSSLVALPLRVLGSHSLTPRDSDLSDLYVVRTQYCTVKKQTTYVRVLQQYSRYSGIRRIRLVASRRFSQQFDFLSIFDFRFSIFGFRSVFVIYLRKCTFYCYFRFILVPFYYLLFRKGTNKPPPKNE